MKKTAIILSLLIILGFAGAWAFGLFGSGDKPFGEPARSQLTGLEVPPEEAGRPVLGVMIENSLPARPQTGLDNAGIVFEAVTEAGITRYLALYQEDMPETVGPVRSLREHFLDWAMGFDASIAHVGGSPEALDLAKERGAKSLGQFEFGKPYFRDGQRQAPHNMYARTAGLRELQRQEGHAESNFATIPRSDDSSDQQPNATTVTVDFSQPDYLAEFRYDKAAQRYSRYLAGRPHIDEATGQVITVKNVIVIKTRAQEAGVRATGNGEALLFNDGTAQTVRWQQPSFRERLKLVDGQGNEIALNRGDSWYAVVTDDREVTYR